MFCKWKIPIERPSRKQVLNLESNAFSWLLHLLLFSLVSPYLDSCRFFIFLFPPLLPTAHIGPHQAAPHPRATPPAPDEAEGALLDFSWGTYQLLPFSTTAVEFPLKGRNLVVHHCVPSTSPCACNTHCAQ